ncbi:MAG TPA: TIGR03560 family F420-dependent LLM class oxidoreductase [Candidatus Limnocylindria bacterium]|jgi:F420-dependent oxidoreductase-like protein
MPMRLALMTEPQQGLSYDEVLAAARAAEEAGLEAFFRSDHFASFPGPEGLPTTEAWSTLAGLARETRTIRIGSLVSPVTFRIPGVLAKQVATVDEMSAGRVELGMGAGWNDEEHAQLGIPFPDLGERYDRFEEAVAIVHGLWTEPDGWGFDGAHWRVEGAHFAPRPAQGERRHPNLILGGDGGPRLSRLVARFADEFNLVSASPDKARDAYGRIDRACEAAGRDPAEVTRSAMTGVLIAETEHELRDRVRAQLEMLGSADADADAWLADRRRRWIMGTLDEAGERVAAMAAAGVERIMLQDFLPRDLDMVRLMPRLAG